MASIQRRQTANGETWRVVFRVDGRQVVESFTNAKAAAEFEALGQRLGWPAARDILATRRDENPSVLLLKDLFDEYVDQLTGVEEATRAEYRRSAERSWLPVLGEMPITALKREHVTSWVNLAASTGRNGRPLSGKTIKNQHSLLSSTVRYAVEERALRPDNPCRGVRLPRTVPRSSVFLSETEFATIYAQIPAQWRLLVHMLASTGLRWGEATALRWSDLDLDAATPVARISRAQKHSVGGGRTESTTKTKRGLRTVSLPAQLVDELRASRKTGNGYVFANDDGSAVDHHYFYLRIWTPAVEAAEIGKRPTIHDLRHSHASWLIARGLSLVVIQRRLGHESITTTVDRYGHLADGALALAADAAADALSIAAPIHVVRAIEA